ncbi:MAG: S8 family serine peptidase, partial [Deltaproteobacteria bacterium]|nr:S8 family serine peptidase [Deltaproteobacteria bacterium]
MKKIITNQIKPILERTPLFEYLLKQSFLRKSICSTSILFFLLYFTFLILPIALRAECPPGVISICDDQFASKFGEYETISHNLLSINADEAYSLGFSGKGVTVGILDSGYSPNHREMIGRTFGYEVTASDNPGEWLHGIHVGGIIAASREQLDDKYFSLYQNGMQGVAYEANIYTVGWDSEEIQDAEILFHYFIDLPEIKVINNSWGDNSELEDYFDDSGNIDPTKIDELILTYAYHIGSFLSKRDVLLVFAAGNDGYLSSDFPGGLASFAPYLTEYGDYIKNNTIDVINVNAEYDSRSLFFVNPTSQMALGSAWYTLMAPGTNIISTAYNYTAEDVSLYLYYPLSGTSMATPVVSGAAALVVEAFPGIEGKQIGDILLSTATDIALENLPPFLIKFQHESDGEENETIWKFPIYSYKSNVDSISSLISDFIESGAPREYVDVYFGGRFYSELLDALDPNKVIILEDDKYKSLFGKGMLNAGEAVKGPKVLDASRLSESDIYYGGPTPSLLYPVNIESTTQSEITWKWLNDITEDQRFSDNLSYPVGIIKLGDGTLELSGINTFTGPSFVEEGVLSLNPS